MLVLNDFGDPIERLGIAVGDMIEMSQLCFELNNIFEEELDELFDFIIILPFELSEVIDEFLAFFFLYAHGITKNSIVWLNILISA